MEKILLIAEEGELKLVEEVGRQLGCSDWLKKFRVVVTGVGAINIARAVAELPRDAEVLNIGYVGSANFDLGSLVEVTEARLNHPNVTYPEPKLVMERIDFLSDNAPLLRAVCYSSTDFVLQSDYRDCVFDMELAFIAAHGFEHLHSLKIVSDNLSLHTYHELTNGVENA